MRSVFFWAFVLWVVLAGSVAYGQTLELTPAAPIVQPGGGVPGRGDLYKFPGSGTYTLPQNAVFKGIEYQVKIMRGANPNPVGISPWTPATVNQANKTHSGEVPENMSPGPPNNDRAYMRGRIRYNVGQQSFEVPIPWAPVPNPPGGGGG